MKTCSKCGQSKALEEFFRNKSAPDGRRSHCKECHQATKYDTCEARAVAYVENTGAPSAGMRDALVDDATADARYDRDVARGMVDAAGERLKEIDGQRASLHRLVDWSMRLDPFAQEDRREQRRAA